MSKWMFAEKSPTESKTFETANFMIYEVRGER